MARTNKKTRIKGLPPKLQLQQKDSITGSFPAKLRTASDNRSGNYKVSWNDRNTINFGQEIREIYPDMRESQWTSEQGFIGQWRFNDQVKTTTVVSGVLRTQFAPTVTSSFITASSELYTKIEYYGSGARLSNDVPFSGLPMAPNQYSMTFSPDVDAQANFRSIADFDQLNLSGTTSNRNGNIGIWVKRTGDVAAGEKAVICQIDGDDTTPPNLLFWVDENNSVGGTVWFDGDENNVLYATSSIKLPKDAWMFLDCQWSNSEELFFATQFGPVSDPSMLGGGSGTIISANSSSFNVGRGPAAEYTFNGITHKAFPGLINEFYWTLGLTNITPPDASLNTVARFSDNRGRIGVDPVFGVNMGGNFNIHFDQYLDSTDQFTTLYVATGSLRKGVSDTIAKFTPGQDLEPFRDSGHPAVDGKSNGNTFYATGSKVEDVGIGFQQPLWAKTKIEIDITNTAAATMGYRSGSGVGGDDWPMMYYNPVSKSYMPVGSRKRWDEYENTADGTFQMDNFISEKAIGFLPAMTLVALGEVERYFEGSPTSICGFPFDSKFFVDPTDPNSGSILIPVSDYIDEPFLVEKIVVDFSCSHQSVDWPGEKLTGGGRFTNPIGTFFLLNQRKGGKTNSKYFISCSVNTAGGSPFFTNLLLTGSLNGSIHSTGSMEVITYNQFMFIPVSKSQADDFTNASGDLSNFEVQTRKEILPIFTKDYDPNGTNLNFTGSIRLSGTINSPLPTQDINLADVTPASNVLNPQPLTFDFRTLELPVGDVLGAASSSVVVANGFNGGRTGIYNKPCNRNLNRNFSGVTETAVNKEFAATGVQKAPAFFSKTPYLLKPGDQLIIGWQGPYPLSEWSLMKNPFPFAPGPIYIGPQLTLPPGPAKITLYGSKVSAGRESHDTLNQLLISEGVHEVIG